MTGSRFKLFHRILRHRTRYITVLLEDTYQSQNASAVPRTSDLGIQDLHLVEQDRCHFTLGGWDNPWIVRPGKGKLVVMFETELNGLTPQALALADEHIRIPMLGFTGSYNISVSAAIILYRLRHRLEASSIGWRLEPDEEELIMLGWLRSSVKMSRQIENQFRQQYGADF